MTQCFPCVHQFYREFCFNHHSHCKNINCDNFKSTLGCFFTRVVTPFPRIRPRNQSSPLINHQNIVGGVAKCGICALQSLCSLDNCTSRTRGASPLSDARRRALRTKDHRVMLEDHIGFFFFLFFVGWIEWSSRIFSTLIKLLSQIHYSSPLTPFPGPKRPLTTVRWNLCCTRYAFSAFSGEFRWAWLIP